MFFAKVALAEAALAAAIIAAPHALDGTAQTIILWGAAGTAILWFWAKILRPAARLIARTIKAVDAFESLPEWRDDINNRIRAVEGEVGKQNATLMEVLNVEKAIVRELGIENQVRRMSADDFGA